MSIELGLFNDEGLMEGGFYSAEEAAKARTERYSYEDELEILPICPDHEGQPQMACEECYAEDTS